jgi:Tfp pilus assembly protein PilZ
MASPRLHYRVPVHLSVEFVDKDDGQRFVGRATNLSLGGVFVETGAYLAFGAAATVFLRLPGSAERLAFDTVMRWKGPEGMGFQFKALTVRQTHLIAQLFVGRSQTLDGHDVAWIG